ncbi:MAG: hypothetical protein JSW00_03985 [Thermoplasmata archaeon]|nr:MAG: hypothetical protein JSW00_03985 [Thermoplasmata archaeon]
MNKGSFWCTGSALNNPAKISVLARADGVGALGIWGFLPDSGDAFDFLLWEARVSLWEDM